MLNILKLHPDAKLPVAAHPGDLGFDLFSLESLILKPFVPTLVSTGIAIELVCGEEPMGALIRDRSSMAKLGIITSAGVIDAGYRGEVNVLLTLINPSLQVVTQDAVGDEGGIELAPECSEAGYLIQAGDRIAQLIPMLPYTWLPVLEVGSLSDTARGSGAFGSSGK